MSANSTPNLTFYGLTAWLLSNRGTAFCCMVALGVIVWKYTLEPGAADRVLLQDAVQANVESTAMIAENSGKVAEGMCSLNDKMDRIIVNQHLPGGE